MTRFGNPQPNRRRKLKNKKSLRGAYATPRLAYAPFFFKMIDLTRGLRDTAAMLTRELFIFVFWFLLRFLPCARPYALLDVAYATPIFTPHNHFFPPSLPGGPASTMGGRNAFDLTRKLTRRLRVIHKTCRQ